MQEMKSCGASNGVIFSKSGFSKGAIEKATANQISCCRLFTNSQAEMPSQLILQHQFIARAQCRVEVSGIVSREIGTWGHLISIKSRYHDSSIDIGEVVEREFNDLCRESGHPRDAHTVPFLKITKSLQIVDDQESSVAITLDLRCTWEFYMAKLEAQLLSGSYCINNRSFIGTQFGPSIDTHSRHPGPGWERIDVIPHPLPINSIVFRLEPKSVSDFLASHAEVKLNSALKMMHSNS